MSDRIPELLLSEAATGGVLYEQVFLENSKNSQEKSLQSLFFK